MISTTFFLSSNFLPHFLTEKDTFKSELEIFFFLVNSDHGRMCETEKSQTKIIVKLSLEREHCQDKMIVFFITFKFTLIVMSVIFVIGKRMTNSIKLLWKISLYLQFCNSLELPASNLEMKICLFIKLSHYQSFWEIEFKQIRLVSTKHCFYFVTALFCCNKLRPLVWMQDMNECTSSKDVYTYSHWYTFLDYHMSQWCPT